MAFKDCHVPAICKMSGCITTDILPPFYSELVGGETQRKITVKMKKINDGREKQKQNKMAAFKINS